MPTKPESDDKADRYREALLAIRETLKQEAVDLPSLTTIKNILDKTLGDE